MLIVLHVELVVLLAILYIQLAVAQWILCVLLVDLDIIVLVLLTHTLVLQVKHINLIGMLQRVLHVKVVQVVNTSVRYVQLQKILVLVLFAILDRHAQVTENNMHVLQELRFLQQVGLQFAPRALLVPVQLAFIKQTVQQHQTECAPLAY